MSLFLQKTQIFDNEFRDFAFCSEVNSLLCDKLLELRLGKSCHRKLKSALSFHLEFADFYSVLEMLIKKSKNRKMSFKKPELLTPYYGVMEDIDIGPGGMEEEFDTEKENTAKKSNLPAGKQTSTSGKKRGARSRNFLSCTVNV
jgi:hypothetical protein